jgi:hypothetical protein
MGRDGDEQRQTLSVLHGSSRSNRELDRLPAIPSGTAKVDTEPLSRTSSSGKNRLSIYSAMTMARDGCGNIVRPKALRRLHANAGQRQVLQVASDRMDKFQALKIFSTVAENGGFASAAKRLGISPSAVTKAISKLETELDVQLFRRSTRHVVLSGPGRLLFEHCSKVFEALSDAEGAVKQMRNSSGGNVRLVMPYSFGRVTFAPELPRFHQRHPNINLDLYFNDDPTNLVAEGFDLAVLSRQLDDSPIIRRVLISVPLVTAAAPRYLATHGTPTSLADLASHNCIIGKFGNR